MLTLGPLAFATPWVLAALAALPVIWWLLRVIPPAPQRVTFPAIRLLEGLRPREDTPHATPWWLLLLRLLIAALVILAIARPLIPSGTTIPPGGPIVLVIDDGWASARDFETRRARALRILDQAEREARPVALLTTAAATLGEVKEASLAPALRAKEAVGALQPKPWAIDPDAVVTAVTNLRLDTAATAVWIRDAVAAPGADTLARVLQRMGALVIIASGDAGPIWLTEPDPGSLELTAELRRLDKVGERPVAVRAVGDDNRVLTRVTGAFDDGARQVTLTVELPTELRNEVGRLEVESETTAAGVFLLDERFKRRPVGLVSARDFEGAQPLLDELYYLDRALAPFTEVRRGGIEALLERDLAVMVLADVGAVPFGQRERLDAWVREGGIAVRFGGPRLAAAGLEQGGLGPDDLVPVRLRRGDRTLGGALSWTKPASLAPFPDNSPFAGLPIASDVTVSRQVLAEPAIDLGEKTWARLQDGTPIVTAERRGDGWLVLVHTTANADWTDLPLSGLFVRMLRRIVALSHGVGGVAERPLPPLSLLDGFGRPQTATTGADPLPPVADRIADVPLAIGPRRPPGYYGDDTTREAVNMGPSLVDATPRSPAPAGTVIQALDAGRDQPLQGWLLAAALVLAVVDTVIGLVLRGLLRVGRLRRGGARMTTILLLVALAGGDVAAQGLPPSQDGIAPRDPEIFALEAASKTRLAYVLTGDPWLDGISRDGLIGLSEVLVRRTAVEPAQPYGLDLERDELAFFPLLYWPIARDQPPLSEIAVDRINTYMRKGGIVVFDTRDRYEVTAPGARGGSGLRRLIALSRDLEIPPLAPVPATHVLTRSFYLLQDYPGRYAGGQVWIEDGSGNPGSEVSPILLGSHDWAAAWAIDRDGRSRFPVVPGGEVQREMAYRFGVNLVMYALTGNYKADQVHIPSILERLGQ